jgi:hypothetical protein
MHPQSHPRLPNRYYIARRDYIVRRAALFPGRVHKISAVAKVTTDDSADKL